MESAYLVGVELALSGNTAKIVRQVAAEFTKLDEVIERAAGSMNSLVAGVRLLRNESEGLSRQWRDLAANAAKFANATRAAGNTGRTSSAGAGAEGPSATGVLSRALVPYVYPGLPAPYRSSSTDYTTKGGPYTPYGGYSLSAPQRTSGGLPVPYAGGGPGGPGNGFTLNGGPYGPGGPQGMAVPPYQPGAGGPIPLANPYGPGGFGGGPGWAQRAWNYRPGSSGSAFGAAIPALAGADFLKNVFEQGAEIGHMKSELLKQGFSPDQVEQAYQASTATQRKVLPSTVTGNMEVISSLMAVLQDPTSSISLMPDYSKAAAVLSRSGKAGDLDTLMAAVRTGEFRGVLSQYNEKTGKEEINPAGLDRMLKEIEAANVITHGQIGPSEFYSFSKAGGNAAAMLSDESQFFQMLPLIQSMGAQRAGTALQAFSMQFSSGRMSQATAKLLSEMNLLHGGTDVKHNPYLRLNPIGNVIMMPGAMDPGAQQQAREHPLDFVYQQMVPKEREWLTKNYGKTYTDASRPVQDEMLLAALQQISSRIPGGTFMVEGVRNRLLTERDVTAGNAALQRDPYAIQTKNDPRVQGAALTAAWQGFEGALGQAAMQPAIDILNALTGDLNQLADWARKNPDGAKQALQGLAAGVGAFAAGSAASAALAILTNKTSGMIALATGIEMLGHSMTSLPSWLINGAAGAAAGFRYGGAPGAIAGGVGGAAWNAGPSGLNDTGWSPLHPFSLSHRGPDGQLHYSWENAPAANAPVMDFSPGHSNSSNPIPVVVTNGHDLVNGVASGIAGTMNAPNTGTLGHDSRIDAGAAWVGGP